MRDRPAGMRHQKMKGVKLAWRQVYLEPAAFDAPPDRIEHNGAVRDRHLSRSFRGSKSSNSSTDSGGQLACLKRLGHVVVSPGLQSLDFVIFTVADRQHKNWDFCVDAPDAPAGLYASYPR